MDIGDIPPRREDSMIDIESMSRNLEYMMSCQRSYTQMECCIFKIPTKLSMHNNKTYEPEAFSIGPFHYKNPHTAATQKIKLRYLQNLVNCSGLRLDDLIKAITRVMEEARGYYADPIGLDWTEFVQILVIDGVFVIELFRKNSYRELIEKEDLVFSMFQLIQYLKHDLILLENQVPWMVLEILFEITNNPHFDKKPLVELAIDFFGTLFSVCDKKSQNEHLLHGLRRSKHILDLLRNWLVLPCLARKREKFWFEESTMCSATELEESGVKILKTIAAESILDVKFKDGVLEVPQLVIHETTDTLFRNLVSLELHCPNYDGLITSYTKLLDDLIQTTNDMKMLCDNGAISNRLHLEKATRIFNRSYEDNAGVKENYYFKLMSNVEQYRRHKKGYYLRRWLVYKRELKRIYFSHPWAVISTFAASLMLIFTFLQTFFTIIAYKL